LKDEEAIDWREGFRRFHWTKGTNSKKGHACLPREKEDKECVRKKLVLMCGKVLFMKKMRARNKHGRISMTKPLEFYFK